MTSFLGAYWEQNHSCWMNYICLNFQVSKNRVNKTFTPFFHLKSTEDNIIHKRYINYLALNMSLAEQ